jgi:hypothetical protein
MNADDALKDAEERIRAVLLNLEEITGKVVDHVEVDTRNFARAASASVWL